MKLALFCLSGFAILNAVTCAETVGELTLVSPFGKIVDRFVSSLTKAEEKSEMFSHISCIKDIQYDSEEVTLDMIKSLIGAVKKIVRELPLKASNLETVKVTQSYKLGKLLVDKVLIIYTQKKYVRIKEQQAELTATIGTTEFRDRESDIKSFEEKTRDGTLLSSFNHCKNTTTDEFLGFVSDVDKLAGEIFEKITIHDSFLTKAKDICEESLALQELAFEPSATDHAEVYGVHAQSKNVWAEMNTSVLKLGFRAIYDKRLPPIDELLECIKDNRDVICKYQIAQKRFEALIANYEKTKDSVVILAKESKENLVDTQEIMRKAFNEYLNGQSPVRGILKPRSKTPTAAKDIGADKFLAELDEERTKQLGTMGTLIGSMTGNVRQFFDNTYKEMKDQMSQNSQVNQEFVKSVAQLTETMQVSQSIVKNTSEALKQIGEIAITLKLE